MTDVEQHGKKIRALDVLKALLSEFSTATDYHVLRDYLPQRLAILLQCRCVLFYQHMEETLQFVAGSFADEPGWSVELLTVAHINPLSLHGDSPEACAWREGHAIAVPLVRPTLVALPLTYHQRGIGVLVALRGSAEGQSRTYWSAEDICLLDVVGDVVALLLENTRLLERDRERIHELSLLNSISSQMNGSVYEQERLKSIVVQRTKEISTADLCEIVEPSFSDEKWVTPALQEMLLQYFREQEVPAPLIIERPGDLNNQRSGDYLQQLSADIKTFFAFPLVRGHTVSRNENSFAHASRGGIVCDVVQEAEVVGIIVGGYHCIRKLRQEEIVLLQVLAGQASAVLENMHLMAEIVEARNEARNLLHQVLDDQRLKQLILESIPSGLITTNRDGAIVTFNRAAEVILGYHSYEVLGQPLHKFLDLRATPLLLPIEHQLEPAQMTRREVWPKKIRTGKIRSETVVTTNHHGQEVVLDVDLLPLYDDVGAQIGLLTTFTNVTSMHKLEEEKRRMDRMALLGEMSANVAHEVRNPLACIKTVMQVMRAELSHDEPYADKIQSPPDNMQAIQESIAVVLKEVERLDSIVHDLLLFARPRQLHRVRCNFADLSDQVLQLIQGQCLAANVVVHRVYSSRATIQVDIAQMEQVLLNLYINALQAMPDGGTLTVSCRAMVKDENTLQETTEGSSARRGRTLTSAERPQWLEIGVSDTGMGIQREQVERIFQPFFTTKAHGIGLGLAITRRLVEDHGGSIHVEGHFGYGAMMLVQLPLSGEDEGWEENEGEEDGG